jgi:hypothetical protein
MQPDLKVCIISVNGKIMKEDKFEKDLEDLQVPHINEIRHQQLLKIALLNSRRSSHIGIAFIVIPCLFLFLQVIKEWIGLDFQFFSAFENYMSQLDKIPLLKWIFPLVLVGLPVIAIIINSLSIVHFYWDKITRELLITIKYKPVNITLILISICIVLIFLAYVLHENIYEQVLRSLD